MRYLTKEFVKRELSRFRKSDVVDLSKTLQHVFESRREGLSLQQIATKMNTTKQSVHKKQKRLMQILLQRQCGKDENNLILQGVCRG